MLRASFGCSRSGTKLWRVRQCWREARRAATKTQQRHSRLCSVRTHCHHVPLVHVRKKSSPPGHIGRLLRPKHDFFVAGFVRGGCVWGGAGRVSVRWLSYAPAASTRMFAALATDWSTHCCSISVSLARFSAGKNRVVVCDSGRYGHDGRVHCLHEAAYGLFVTTPSATPATPSFMQGVTMRVLPNEHSNEQPKDMFVGSSVEAWCDVVCAVCVCNVCVCVCVCVCVWYRV